MNGRFTRASRHRTRRWGRPPPKSGDLDNSCPDAEGSQAATVLGAGAPEVTTRPARSTGSQVPGNCVFVPHNRTWALHGLQLLASVLLGMAITASLQRVYHDLGTLSKGALGATMATVTVGELSAGFALLNMLTKMLMQPRALLREARPVRTVWLIVAVIAGLTLLLFQRTLMAAIGYGFACLSDAFQLSRAP